MCTIIATSGNAFVKELWDIAETASELTGPPYQDPKQPGKCESALHMYCERHLKV